MLEYNRLERLHDSGGLGGVTARTNFQVDVRLVNLQLSEKQITHRLVVVLAAV
jgi:hypothetical protein